MGQRALPYSGILLLVLPVCVKGRDVSRIVEIVGQDSGVVVEPEKVKGAVDPLLLALCKFREPGKREPLGEGSGGITL